MNTQRWQDWLNVLLGAWLAVSPFLLGYTSTPAAMWTAMIVGGLVLVLAFFELGDGPVWEEWATFLLGAWAVLAPWVLGFSGLGTPVWNMVIVGVLIAGLAFNAARGQVKA